MFRSNRIRRWKAAMLTSVMLAGSTLFTSCGLTDLRDSVIAGTLDFITAYTQNAWDAATPAIPELFP